jgi:hypothetical protein
MKDDTRQLFDDLLCQWHHWSGGYRAIADVGSSPMFNQCRSGRQYDSQYELAEQALDNDAMKSVDFHVYELPPEQRTAIQINARNLVTGRNVWRSVRLPQDVVSRAILLAGARAALMCKLVDAGIL